MASGKFRDVIELCQQRQVLVLLRRKYQFERLTGMRQSMVESIQRAKQCAMADSYLRGSCIHDFIITHALFTAARYRKL